jgi:hypothetical protein
MYNNNMLHWLKMHFIPHEGNGHRPHILHTKNVHRIIGFVIFVEVFAFLIPTIAFVGRADNGIILPSVLSDLTNQERVAQNLPPLVIDPKLNEAAQAKADDMAKNSYFAHISPDGKTPWYWIEQAGYNYSHAGENLAVNFTDAQDVANAWMNSPAHRANILKANYTQIGTGVAEGMYQGYDTIFIAQDFGTPAVAPTVISPAAVSTPATKSPLLASQKSSVLGAETAVSPTHTAAMPPKISASSPAPAVAPVVTTTRAIHPTLLQRLQSSPRNTTNIILFAILAFIVIAVFLNIGIKISHHHPDLILNGVMVIAIIGTVFVMNNYITASTIPLSQSVDYTAQHVLL